MQSILELNNIRLVRGDFTLQVERLVLSAGGLYTLKGENGSGKSTLLQLLALLRPSQAGTFLFAGRVVRWRGSVLRHLRQQVTLLEQNPFLFAGSVEQNLAFGLKLRGFQGADLQRRIDQALESSGLTGFNQRQARELSGGETRRVALARALALQPKLLLLDEPTANLDTGQLAALERFLKTLPATGMTLVVATHDDLQPQRLGGRNIYLEQGKLAVAEEEDHLFPEPTAYPLLQKPSKK